MECGKYCTNGWCNVAGACGSDFGHQTLQAISAGQMEVAPLEVTVKTSPACSMVARATQPCSTVTMATLAHTQPPTQVMTSLVTGQSQASYRVGDKLVLNSSNDNASVRQISGCKPVIATGQAKPGTIKITQILNPGLGTHGVLAPNVSGTLPVSAGTATVPAGTGPSIVHPLGTSHPKEQFAILYKLPNGQQMLVPCDLKPVGTTASPSVANRPLSVMSNSAVNNRAITTASGVTQTQQLNIPLQKSGGKENVPAAINDPWAFLQQPGKSGPSATITSSHLQGHNNIQCVSSTQTSMNSSHTSQPAKLMAQTKAGGRQTGRKASLSQSQKSSQHGPQSTSLQVKTEPPDSGVYGRRKSKGKYSKSEV